VAAPPPIAEALPVTQLAIANAQLEITQRFEMLDTVTGTPLGTTPASAAGAGTFHQSNRYVLKHTYTIRNKTAAVIANVNLFQFLHGVQSERGLYDNRLRSGPLSAFRYDTTLAGLSPDGLGGGLEDYLTFHSKVRPMALEMGCIGTEGNGVDNHGIGKPTDGVHRSIEANWATAPYDARQGLDQFAPAQRWVAGAQRWTLGSLNPNQAVSFEVVLSILTGSKVAVGTTAGSCDGGSQVPGGLDYAFENVETEGTCFSDFSRADQNEVAVRISEGEFPAFTFQTPSQPTQLWKVDFSGSFSGAVNVTFGYDPTLLPPGFAESGLALYHSTGGAWEKLPGAVNATTHAITASTTSLGVFALGADAITNYVIGATAAPANSGTITGGGSYVEGSGVTLSAVANPGYFFTNWTEDATVVSTSPAFTFIALGDRTLVANFTAVGSGRVVTTSATPTAGGTTGGGGEYALGSKATVSATAYPGYKFSKWLLNGSSISISQNFTFTVSGDVTLVAKFKPVYYLTIAAEPPEGGEPEGDLSYEWG